MRFFGLGTSLIVGLWWLSFVMTAAISMGPSMARQPTKFLMPDGYVGWIEIRYGKPSAPALPVVNGELICRIPQESLVDTSSLVEGGWAKDEYLYYSPVGSTFALKETGWGSGGMIWGGSHEWKQVQDRSDRARVDEYFFVGTEEQYRLAVSAGEKRPFNQSSSAGAPIRP